MKTIIMIFFGILIGFGVVGLGNYNSNKMWLYKYYSMKLVLNNSQDTIFIKNVTEYKDHFIIEKDSSIIRKSNIVWFNLGKKENYNNER